MTTYSFHTRAIVWALVAGQVLMTAPLIGDPSVVSAFRRTENRPGKMEPWTWKPPIRSSIDSSADASVGPNSSVGLDFSRAQTARPTRTRRITPNRTVPHVDPVPTTPVFSASPTDQEIFRARIFSEPLVPVMATSAEENQALVRAINTDSANRVAPFEQFLADYPASGWRPSLLANFGFVYLQSGRPSKALQAWDAAWQATKHETVPLNHALADYALGNWLQLTANMGRVPALIERFNEVDGRDVGGPAGSKLRAAREALWVLENHHELAAGSGVMALNAILRSRAGTDYTPPRALEQYHAVPAGASLTEMQALASEVGLRFQMAFTSANVRVPVPSMVHLKTDHFTAVLEERGNQYRLRDAIFAGDAWVTREALLEESSGYFLIREGDLADGWRAVPAVEGSTVIGHCLAGSPDDEDPCPCGGPGAGGGGGGGNGGPPPGFGMPVYDFMPNRAALRLVDTPVGYSPPKGPSVYFKLTYSGRRLFTQWCVIATMVLAAACDRAASVPGDQHSVPGEAIKIEDVHIRAVNSGISVHYRTSTSIRDCGAQAAEMPKVWDLVVKDRLGESPVQRVVLFPEDTSGQSVSIEFTKGASGQWSAAVPCSIRIPAG